MIKSIDGLALPPSITSTAELTNRDSTRQTVSGRLVVELDPTQKWEVSADFGDASFTIEYQRAFYNKCLAMRSAPAMVEFISPYDGELKSVSMLCTRIDAPAILSIRRRTKTPQAYNEVKAVFREV